ncbi:MAG: CBS domain-containing protein [Pseudomonadales bacterium]
MTTVHEMLDSKGRDVWSIAPESLIYDAVELMEQKEVGALTILDQGQRLIGIVSERDCARKVILDNKPSRETQVADIMTKAVISVDEETTVDECMALMASNKIRHLPVMQDDSLIGIIAVGDVLKWIIREQSAVIEELENYVKDETGGSG